MINEYKIKINNTLIKFKSKSRNSRMKMKLISIMWDREPLPVTKICRLLADTNWHHTPSNQQITMILNRNNLFVDVGETTVSRHITDNQNYISYCGNYSTKLYKINPDAINIEMVT